MKKLLTEPKKRRGVTLIELIVVLAITAMMVPAAFAVFGNQDRSQFDIGMQQIQSDLRLALNRADTGIGPEPSGCPGPSCPLHTDDLLFGERIQIPEVSSTKKYISDRLLVRSDNSVASLGGTYAKTVNLPPDIQFTSAQTKSVTNAVASLSTPASIVFYKFNRDQTTLPVQTRVFGDGSWQNSNNYTTNSTQKARFDFSSTKNTGITGCIIINLAGNDIQQYSEQSKCNSNF